MICCSFYDPQDSKFVWFPHNTNRRFYSSIVAEFFAAVANSNLAKDERCVRRFLQRYIVRFLCVAQKNLNFISFYKNSFVSQLESSSWHAVEFCALPFRGTT